MDNHGRLSLYSVYPSVYMLMPNFVYQVVDFGLVVMVNWAVDFETSSSAYVGNLVTMVQSLRPIVEPPNDK